MWGGQDWPPRKAASRKLKWRFRRSTLVDVPNHHAPGGNAMKQFIAKFESQIQGTLSGFDRVLFRGSLRRLTHGEGMKMYLIRNGLLCKQFGDHVKKASAELKEASLAPLLQQKLPVEYIRDSQADKDQIARACG
jgi:hypothetical protein